MARCAQCGNENVQGFRFCGYCGSALPETEDPHPGEQPTGGEQPTAPISSTAPPRPPGPPTDRLLVLPRAGVIDRTAAFLAARRSAVIASAVLAGLLVGAVLAYANGERAEAERIVARQRVGPAGAQLDLESAGTLHIPLGAVRSPTTVTVRRHEIAQRVRVVPPGRDDPIEYPPGSLVAYEFLPRALRFDRPASITLTSRGADGAVFVLADGTLRFVAADRDEGGRLRFTTRSFDFEGED